LAEARSAIRTACVRPASRPKLADIRRATLVDEDARIFPGWYAPVMVMEGGRRVIKPMRYQCRG